ncbi:MAG: transporter associated domain-containing protein, partial [Planctomycetota bacterium]|nr:transporter associated domain-containing protein [Planctomycetota bacterium]
LLAIIALGDIVPKALATAHRGVVSRVVVRPLSAWVWLTRPVLAALDKLAITPLLRLIRPDRPARPTPAQSQAELSEMLRQAGEAGALSRDEERMLREVLDLRTLRVRDVMTPRVDVAWIEADAPPERVLELVRRTGHTKLPVCKARFAPPTLHGGKIVSGVLGLLNAKTWLAQPATLRPREAVEPILYVPDRLPLDRLMARFRETRAHVALAADESGEIVGLVEIEDVVNRLVLDPGEVALDQGLQIRIVGLNRWLIPGRLALHQLTDFFGVAPPSSDAATVSGLILERIGRLPAEGDTVELPGLRLTVRQLFGRSVRAAELELLADDAPTRTGEEPPEEPA